LVADKSCPEIVTEPLPDLMLWLDLVFPMEELNFLAATILGSLAGVIAGFVLLGR
jgi:hypothetical protein